MAIERDRLGAQAESASPLAAGLEAGLVGAAVAIVLQLLGLALATAVPALPLLFYCLNFLVWVGIGLLAAYWLRQKGPATGGRQAQAGALAGLMAAFADRLANGLISLLMFGGDPLSFVLPPEVTASMPPEALASAKGAFWITFFFCSGIMVVFGALLGLLGGFLGGVMSGGKGPAEHPAAVKPREEEGPPRPKIAPEILPALNALQRGDRPRARQILAVYLRKNPRDEKAWLLLERALDDPKQRRDCLRRVLAINPSNSEASDRLHKLEREMGL
jgi:hypothetical protein